MNPERGRKLLQERMECLLVVISEHEPRKGTETYMNITIFDTKELVHFRT